MQQQTFQNTGKYALSIAFKCWDRIHQEQPDKGCFHLGFYEVVGMWAKPNNVYIAPYIYDPIEYYSGVGAKYCILGSAFNNL
jgi:hypothetical protein